MKKLLTVFIIMLHIFGILLIQVSAQSETSSDSNGYIVKLKDDAQISNSLFSEAESIDGHGIICVETESELKKLLDTGVVAYYEPNGTVLLQGVVNDEHYGSQWNLRDTNVSAAWDKGLFGEGVIVAVIDSGINAQHEDFVGMDILSGANVIDGSNDTTDSLGHGTFICGIIAAARNNNLGIAGIADKVSILPIKCFSDTDQASIFNICRGIYKAVDEYGCDVICLSLGSSDNSLNFEEAVDYAASKNVIVVSAVGNEGSTQLYYPAAYDSVIGVASYDPNGLCSSFSQKNSSVFVSAPGSSIMSTYIGSPNAYATAGGTSFSTPHLAAMAAIAKSEYPDMNTSQFEDMLIATCRDAGEEGYDEEFGYGKIDFDSFVTALLSGEFEDEAEAAFEDVSGHWAETAINSCVDSGLFNGVSDTLFAPDGTMTRAMLVTVLYRYDNGALPSQEDYNYQYSDVSDSSAWYYEAVFWAASNGIVNGYEDLTFRPNEPITREQLVSILYRYCGSPIEEDTAVLMVFNDYANISPYASSALTWSYKAGLISGTGNSMLSPSGYATRAQVAQIMMRYAQYS